MIDRSTRQRFRDKVSVCEETGCWNWTGATHPSGYGMFKFGDRMVYAHRWLWEFARGPIPHRYELDHLCRNKACVRPGHLEVVTHGENMRRAGLAGSWSGSRNGNARRTETEVMVLKFTVLYFPIPLKMLAKAMRIPLRSAYAIIRGEVWRHIEPPADMAEEM